MTNLPRLLFLAVLAVSTLALAEPLGPDTRLDGFDREQSRMVYEEGNRIFNEARRKFAIDVKMTAEDIQCGVAQFMAGAIQAAAFQHGRMSQTQIHGAMRALTHLGRIIEATCRRPPGGGLGSGNAGDKVAQAFFNAYAPQARSIADEVRERLGRVLSAENARLARDALLAGVLVAAGLVTMPLWAS